MFHLDSVHLGMRKQRSCLVHTVSLRSVRSLLGSTYFPPLSLSTSVENVLAYFIDISFPEALRLYLDEKFFFAFIFSGLSPYERAVTTNIAAI